MERPTPLLTWSGTKAAWFFTSCEAYETAQFVRGRKKMAAMPFVQVQRFILVEKIFWG